MPPLLLHHCLGSRVDEFEIDPELNEALRGVRESVRKLFEQLRLKHEDGDVSGKERLERVPALAKHNFRNLTGPIPHLAIKEAWRLVDFLEGRGGEARLSLRAREALRAIELDKQLATFRASDCWKEAATALRRALSIPRTNAHMTVTSAGDGAEIDQRHPVASASETSDEPRGDHLPGLKEAGTKSASIPGKLRRPIVSLLIGIAAPIALAVLAAIWMRSIPANPRMECLAFESASSDALAAHWAVDPGTLVALPAPDATRPSPVMFTISDPTDGRPIRSIYTTSQFSFEEGTGRQRPGGGRADFRLRVGGYGDTYLTLLRFPIRDNRLVRQAVIRLVVLGDEPESQPTTMILRIVNDPWNVLPGPQHRLWWRDCPRSEVVRRNLPVPGPPESSYDIDITDIYNQWARGFHANHGIMLEPEHIGSYGRARDHYSNFSTFYSTRAIDPANRPKVILTY